MSQLLKSNTALLTIIVVAFVLRLGLVGLLHGSGYTSDEKEYLLLAKQLAAGEPFIDTNGEWSTKAPLWPFILSIVFRVFGEGLIVPHLLVCLLGAGSVFLAYLLALELFESKVIALISAALLSFYPSLIVYSDILQTEALYIVFVLLTFLYLERMRRQPTMFHGVLVGVFAAGATLTRAVFFGFFIVMLGLVCWMFRNEIRVYAGGILVAALVWVLLLVPWTVRNYQVHSALVPISTWGGISLLLGNNPYSTGTWSSKQGFETWFSEKAQENGLDLGRSSEVQRSALGRKLAVEFMFTHPVEAVKLSIKKFYMHWVYPITNSDSNIKLQMICVAGDVVLYSFAGIGFIVLGDKKRRFIPVFAAILFFTLLQTVMHCEARYRLPIMPFIALLSASAVGLLVDTRKTKEFFNIQLQKVSVIAWLGAVALVYAFTAWQFLSGTI